jgi:hypothetical protein
MRSKRLRVKERALISLLIKKATVIVHLPIKEATVVVHLLTTKILKLLASVTREKKRGRHLVNRHHIRVKEARISWTSLQNPWKL